MRAATHYQRTLAVFAFTVLAAGEFWRHLLGWWGWGALAILVAAAAVFELVRMRVDPRRLPLSLLLFVGFTALSIIWSLRPGSAALAVLGLVLTVAVAAMLATCLNWHELLATFSTALRWILGASLVFELFVAAVLQRRILPLWVDFSDLEKIPSTFYWSRALLFEGGRIQGIVGNANVLAMLTLVALIVFVGRLLARQGSPLWAWFWIGIAVATFALTRSATIIVAAVAVVYVAVIVVLLRRASDRVYTAMLVGSFVVTAAIAVAVVLARGPLLALLGRSPDLTNRLDIWQAVGELVLERPAAGWGWGFWAAWNWPFEGFDKLNNIGFLSAHNSWLDVLLQVGVIGLIPFALLVLGAFVRSGGMALDVSTRRSRPSALAWPLSATPLLLLVALLVQSLAESQLLWELGFALLVIIATKSGWRDPHGAEANVRAVTA
jgi:exopolysaccharide production protein ExoQ